MKPRAGTWRRICSGTVLHPVRSTPKTPGTTKAISLQVQIRGLSADIVFLHECLLQWSLCHAMFYPIAINGYVAETLPGLLVAQHQLVRWHLLNVGRNSEYHAVHFHGSPFTIQTKQEHRMGVYNLYPGKYTRSPYLRKRM